MDYLKLIKEINNEQIRKDLPKFGPGDTIRVNVKIKEDKKYRIQAFEGVVIKKQGSGITQSVVVRKTASGVSIERTLPLNSPIIDSIEIIKRGRVRRARIYYIRNLSGKAARIKEKLAVNHYTEPNLEKQKTRKQVKSFTASKNLINYQRSCEKALNKKKASLINPIKQAKRLAKKDINEKEVNVDTKLKTKKSTTKQKSDIKKATKKVIKKQNFKKSTIKSKSIKNSKK